MEQDLSGQDLTLWLCLYINSRIQFWANTEHCQPLSLPNITGKQLSQVIASWLKRGRCSPVLLHRDQNRRRNVYDQSLKSKIKVLRSNAWPSREQRRQYFQPDHCSLILTPLNISALKCLNRLPCWTLRENQRIFWVPLKSDFGQPFHHPWEEFCNFRASRFLNFLSLWRLSRKVVHNLRTCIIPPVLTALHTACGAAFVWALMYYLQPGLPTYLIMPWLKHVQPWTIKPLFFKLLKNRSWTSDVSLQNTGLKKNQIKTRR